MFLSGLFIGDGKLEHNKTYVDDAMAGNKKIFDKKYNWVTYSDKEK